ncbi:DUF4232 domain-containing protein [Streptomyces sp. HMX87]|uniref:DUF4232 domain-containing protein n=1 Tax=Streptomyces sp. HMX87 TaxID=3390849 RepID=UPI003A85E76E
MRSRPAPSRPLRRAVVLASAVVVLGALTSCGGGQATSGTPQPTRADRATSTLGAASGTPTASPAAGDTAASASASARTDGRCQTSELRATVGRVDPGAGQRNFPMVLTNTSDRTCTLYGYPGAAFVDASGKQLGPDPERAPASPETVRLTPGASAWAGLSFASPEISGARTAEPAALLVTPPDEHDSLKVKWTAGEVPVGGNESSVSVTALAPGTGP